MTAVGNHVELDREHAEEVFGCIDDFVTDPRSIGPMRALLSERDPSLRRILRGSRGLERVLATAAGGGARLRSLIPSPRKTPLPRF